MTPHLPAKRGPIGSALSLAALLTLAALPLAAQSGDRAERIHFAISSGPAEAALQEFSLQAGRQIIMLTELAQGVRVRPIEGDFTPATALALMLAGTGLEASEDERTQAFAIRRRALPPARSDGRSRAPPLSLAAVAPEPEISRLSPLIVTGSNIPTANDAAAVPVTVVGGGELQATGAGANVLDALAKAIPAFDGRYNAGNGNAARANQTLGGSQLALRNLNVLVLIDGRRVQTSGAQGLKGNDFVDVSQIPIASLERVEVVTDGASAIYGSDAVGGVVNFILKSDYSGAETGGRYAAGGNGYWERSGYVMTGAASHGLALTVSGSASKTAPLFEAERPFSDNITGQSSILSGVVGTDVLASNLTSPSQNNPVGAAAAAATLLQLVANGTYRASTAAAIAGSYASSPYVSLLIGQEQLASAISGSADLGGKQLTLYTDLLFAKVTDFTQSLPAQISLTVPAGAPYNPLIGAVSGVGFADFAAPRQISYSTQSSHSAFGLRGRVGGGWTYDLSYTYGDSRLTERETNLLFTPNLARAVAGVLQPALDPFARIPNPGALVNVLGSGVLQGTNHLAAWDSKIVGDPFELPAGKLSVAIGAQQRSEHQQATPDPNSFADGPTAQLWAGGVFIDPFNRSRTVKAFFGEVRVPITSAAWPAPGAHALDVDLAGRVERYSDAGTSRVPKIGLRWQPLDEQVTLRYSYSESFVAPTLYQKYSPYSQGLGQANVVTNLFGVPGGQYQAVVAGNPELRPTTEISHSGGVVVSPQFVPGLTFSVDYLSAVQKNFPAGTGANVILASVDQQGPQSPYAQQVAFNAAPGQPGAVYVAAPLQISSYLKSGGSAGNIFLSDPPINQAGARIQALDISVAYSLPRYSWGRLKLTSAATAYPTYDFKALPGQPFYQYAGYVTNGGAGFQGTLPKYRTYSVIDWRRGGWEVSVANTYVPAVTDIGAGGITYATSATLRPLAVDRYTSWDLRLSFRYRGLQLAIGVDNLFNRMPPLSPQASGPAPGADTNTYSAIGRLVWASVGVKR